jgi:hypothetical protein
LEQDAKPSPEQLAARIKHSRLVQEPPWSNECSKVQRNQITGHSRVLGNLARAKHNDFYWHREVFYEAGGSSGSKAPLEDS